MAVVAEIMGLVCKVEDGKWLCKQKSFQRHLKTIERYFKATEPFETCPDPDEKSAKRMVQYFKDAGFEAKIIDLGPEPDAVTNRIY